MINYKKVDSEFLEYIAIAEVQELPNGERLFVDIDDLSIVVFNIAGAYFAIGNVCSHDDNPLDDGELAEGPQIVCPRHGARFELETGEAVGLPATEDIPAYPVRIVDRQIEVGIPLS